ncbi:CaiB/BaiF CoA transferase family protein [Chloroflexota bacterium]
MATEFSLGYGSNRGGVLSGYRVLDLTDDKGVFCSRLLADMGAEVIKLEKPRQNSARGLFFWATNLGKKSITLNLEVREGQEIFKRLAQAADIIVESYRPGYLPALGLDYVQLSKNNPRLVMASITSFGQSGPYKDYNSSDIVASALSGQMYVCGDLETPPLKPFGEQAYYSASLFASIGIMLALQNRHATGRGKHIDISVQECATATLDHVLVRYFYEGVVAKRQGSLYWNNAFRIFPCRDGYILLTLFHQWETLVEWLDAEGMAEDLTDKQWREREYRLKHLDHIIDVLEQWTQSHTMAELVEQGQLMHFPWAEVTSIPQLIDSPQLKERDFWVEVDHPETGIIYEFPGAPCRLSKSPWQVGSRVPILGQDNMTIYHGELGLPQEEIEALIKKGVI